MRNITKETLIVEKFVIEILKSKGFILFDHRSDSDATAVIDIIADGKRIDVKYAHPTLLSSRRRIRIWDFDLRKGNRKNRLHTDLDFFVCVGFRNNTPRKVYLVPYSKAKLTHLRISIFGISKWEEYCIWSA